MRATFDDVFSDNVIDAKPSPASEDFCYLPQAWGVPYYVWLVGSTPEELLDNPPVNHQSNFIPDFDEARPVISGDVYIAGHRLHELSGNP